LLIIISVKATSIIFNAFLDHLFLVLNTVKMEFMPVFGVQAA